MPIANLDDINLYYQIHGKGPNLVLIEGLGFHSWMWYRQVPAFAPHFRTLIYDNRGVGKSDKPPGPYTHQQNAADLAGLLDTLGWEKTHVLGVSMGGFIAQQFALSYPERLDRLVLVATAFGGPNMVPVPPEALRFLLPAAGMGIEERMRGAAHLSYGDPAWPDRHPAEFAQIVHWREEMPQPPEATLAQAMAATTFNAEPRLGEIAAPTLVVAGDKDGVVPSRNAELLAEAIPGARLAIIPGGAHHLFYELADAFNQIAIDFLRGEE